MALAKPLEGNLEGGAFKAATLESASNEITTSHEAKIGKTA
jgi:hypothetical protein